MYRTLLAVLFTISASAQFDALSVDPAGETALVLTRYEAADGSTGPGYYLVRPGRGIEFVQAVQAEGSNAFITGDGSILVTRNRLEFDCPRFPGGAFRCVPPESRVIQRDTGEIRRYQGIVMPGPGARWAILHGRNTSDIFELPTGRTVPLPARTNEIDRDGQALTQTAAELILTDTQGRVRRWNKPAGTQYWRIAPDGSYLAGSRLSGGVAVWHPDKEQQPSNVGQGQFAGFSQSGRWIVTFENGTYFLVSPNGQVGRSLPGSYLGEPLRAEFPPAGSRGWALTASNRFLVIDTETGEVERVLPDIPHPVRKAESLAPGLRVLMEGSIEGRAERYELDGEPLPIVSGSAGRPVVEIPGKTKHGWRQFTAVAEGAPFRLRPVNALVSACVLGSDDPSRHDGLLHLDGSPVSKNNPARVGETVELALSGFGPVEFLTHRLRWFEVRVDWTEFVDLPVQISGAGRARIRFEMPVPAQSSSIYASFGECWHSIPTDGLVR